MTNSNLRERLISEIQAEGFDTLSACQWADRYLAELRQLNPGEYRIIGTMTIRRNG